MNFFWQDCISLRCLPGAVEPNFSTGAKPQSICENMANIECNLQNALYPKLWNFSAVTYKLNNGDRSIEFLYFSLGHEGGVAGEAAGGICSPWSQKGASALIELSTTEINAGNVSCRGWPFVILYQAINPFRGKAKLATDFLTLPVRIWE